MVLDDIGPVVMTVHNLAEAQNKGTFKAFDMVHYTRA